MRNQSIDLVKIIAMIMVMGLHICLGRLNQTDAFLLSRISGIAIPLFFMVSGFLLFNQQKKFKYSIKKISRIVKFVCIICLLHYLLFNAIDGQSIVEYPKMVLGAFLQKREMGVLWYFLSMILIYLLLPIMNNANIRYPLFKTYLLALLLAVIFVFHISDMVGSFEKNYILQPLRIWYWLFYFTLGGAFHNLYQCEIFKKISISGICLYIIIFLSMFVAYVYIMRNHIGGIEYFFGSPLCWLYAISVFTLCIRIKIINNRIVSLLANLFLPVYVIHMTVIKHVTSFNHELGVNNVLIDFFSVIIVTIFISYIIMKIPYANKIFRI